MSDERRDASVETGSEPVPRVRLRGIRKSFGTTEALRGVDLDLAPGEILGIVGDNAAGNAQRRHIQMAYQDLSLCDTIDVAGNLYLGREPRKHVLGVPFIDRKRMHIDAAEALEKLDIKVSSTRLTVANLSGGQRQSIAIGRAASFEPRVLILDEPTSALAVAEVEAVLRLIKRVADRGVSVILITHRLQDIFRVCDRVMVMYEGTNVAERAIDDTNLDDLVMLIVGGEAAAARVSA